jgi:Asp-tRNA(Asn)/Glu-tRNA(Gln) amidotransferase A subunit family amidase
VAAGLVGFAIGTETIGSILSPCDRCGVTGLRPTFGRISRAGLMQLSWSMDKIGPMCRTVEDTAIVFDAIYGPDGVDPSVIDMPFEWTPDLDISKLRVGYVKKAFEKKRKSKRHSDKTLEVLSTLGIDLIPVKLPEYPLKDLKFLVSVIVTVDGATVFDELTRNNNDDFLLNQGENGKPNNFRSARFVPAVEYVLAQRFRTLLIREMANMMKNIDVYITPKSDQKNIILTNLIGHPTVIIPDGFSKKTKSASSITFTGKLFREDETLALAKAYQNATKFHLQHPTMNYSKTNLY